MIQHRLWLCVSLLAWSSGLVVVGDARGADSPKSSLFDRSNLVAWCIVPFDATKRGPAERAKMVKEIGLQRVAYDWRSEHVPTFEAEIECYKENGIDFFAFWSWHDSIEPLIKKYGIHPQIWVMVPAVQGTDDAAKVEAAVTALLPMVKKTRALGLRLGLYNHGGWEGEPENLVSICKLLRDQHQADHVGIVYNFHHGHQHVDRFSKAFALMKPFLLCLNLNGMADPKKVDGLRNKILPLGKGDHELEMMQEVVRQGYQGPIGILDHRSDVDSKEALQQNLNGLDQLVTELD